MSTNSERTEADTAERLLPKLFPHGSAIAIFRLITLGLSIIMLFFALRQLASARKTVAVLEQLNDTIEESLPTKYVGPFPDNMSAINELLKGARENGYSVTIVADRVRYGGLSNYSKFIEYQNLLRALGKNVKMAVYEEGKAQETRRIQIGTKEEDYQRIKTRKRYDDFWVALKDEHEKYLATNELDDKIENFHRFLDEEERHYRAHVRRLGIDLRDDMTETVQLFCWITEVEAVFSFLTETEKTHDNPEGLQEVSFRTSNGMLIAELKGLIKSHFENSAREDEIDHGLHTNTTTLQPAPQPASKAGVH